MEEIIETFTDKKGRKIDIIEDTSAIIAKYNSQEIGRFDYDIIDDDFNSHTLLTNISIDINYRRSGIGKRIIVIMEDFFNDFHIVHHFSDDGAKFINYCIEKVFKLEHKTINDERF